MTNSWVKGLLCGILFLLHAMASAQQSVSQVVIVPSSENAYFRQSIESLVDNFDQETRFKVVMAADLADSEAAADSNALYVTLGQSAAEAVNRLEKNTRSISAYLTLEQSRQLNGDKRTAVLLDQPLHRYLAFCKLILSIESIGVIEDQRMKLDSRQAGLLRNLKLELNQYELSPTNKLLPVLRRLLGQNDALLMLPRQSIYNRDSLKGVLLTSYRNRKPAISYSPAHVKSGALASIYSSPTDIGRHLALLVNRRLKNPGYRAADYEYARYYSITTNRKVARALGIDLPTERELRAALDRLEP